MINQPFTRLLFDNMDGVKGVPFVGVNIQSKTNAFMINADDGANMVTSLMVIAVTFLLWTAAFFKLKEKQV